MKKTRVKLHEAAFKELRNAPGVAADMERRAKAIAEAAGEGFVVLETLTTDGRRARTSSAVAADTHEAKLAAIKDMALLRAIDAGRL